MKSKFPRVAKTSTKNARMSVTCKSGSGAGSLMTAGILAVGSFSLGLLPMTVSELEAASRTDAESATPVTVISAEEIENQNATPATDFLSGYRSFQQRLAEDHNIDFRGGITTVFQAASDRVTDQGQLWTGSYDIEIGWRGVNSEEFGNGQLGMLIEGGEVIDHNDDESLSTNIGSDFGINDDADSQEIAISEFWWQHSFLDDRVTFTVGKIDQTAFFDQNAIANDETAAFLATPLVNSTAIGLPDNGLGANVWVDLISKETGKIRNIYFTAGFGDANADAREMGFSTFQSDELFYAAEVGATVDAFGLPGTYRAMFWSTTMGGLEGTGFSFSFDQSVVEERYVLFGRFSTGNQDVVSFEQQVSLGFALNNPFGREDDQAAIAFAYGELAGASRATEFLTEAYYRYNVCDVLAITPAVQIIHHPISNAVDDTIFVGSLRAQFSF